MEEKIYDIKLVARYIALSLLTKQMTVSPLKLQKLLYYAQAWSMVFFGRQRHLLPEDFETTKETMDGALCSVTKQLNLSDDEIQLSFAQNILYARVVWCNLPSVL